jgi:hypothetical protein
MFGNYAFNLSGWAMQSGMGYLFDLDIVQAYCEGGWDTAKYKPIATTVSNAQLKQDNTILYGALMISTHNRARRYLLDARATMDILKVWLKLRANFNGETKVLHQTIQLLKHLDRPYSPNIPGGMLGYIDQILHILNQIDDADPTCIHHARYNDQQKMSLILR